MREANYIQAPTKSLNLSRALRLMLLCFALVLPIRTVAQEIVYYDLWLGSTQVTSENKDNILNQVDDDGNPTAIFYSDEYALILNNPTINGTHNNSKIYSGLELEKLYIAGKYHMSEKETDYGFLTDKTHELKFWGYEDEKDNSIISDFIFYGNKCGVSCGSLHILDCFFKAKGGDYGVQAQQLSHTSYTLDLEGGVKALDGSLNDRTEYGLLSLPEGGCIKNKQFYESDGTTIAKHVLYETPVIKYDLWLGNTQVHSLNQDDIFGDGKASFDPTTNTLSLNNPMITGDYGREVNRHGKIYACDMDLNIMGSYHMTQAETDDGIVLDNYNWEKYRGYSLTLDGDFTIIGNLSCISGSDKDTITIKTGSLTAISVHELYRGCGIWGFNKIYVEDGVSYIDLLGCSSGVSLRGDGEFHLADGYQITTPKNAIFQDNDIYLSDGMTIAKNVVIQKATNAIQFYDLWVGRIHVNETNQNDILGDGKVSFDPLTSTLTLHDNPTIPGTTYNSKIFSMLPDLTVKGSYHMTEAETQNGFYAYGGSLKLNGSFSILSRGYRGIDYRGNVLSSGFSAPLIATGNITLNGDINVQGHDVDSAAIYTKNGNITVQGGNLRAIANNSFAISCGGTFTAMGNCEEIILEGNPGAIYAGTFIIDRTEGDQLLFYEPSKAFFDGTQHSVYHLEGGLAHLASHVVLSGPHNYNLWLGCTQVTYDNRSNILGDGKASFDPKTKTLTLNNPNISGMTNDCAIYGEWMDLTVKGSANISTTASCAIKLLYGELTLDGNFNLTGNDYAIWFNRTMKLGQTIEITSPENAVFMGENTVVSGGNVAKSVTIQNVDKYKIWLGNTQVTSLNLNDILGDGKARYNPDTQTLTLHNPTINGTYSVGKIFAKDNDLTINGSYNMSEADERVGLYVSNCALTLIGDFTFRGSIWGVTSDKDITVKGNLKAIGEGKSGTGIHFDNGNCVLTLERGFMASRVEMTGGQDAMSGGSVADGATLLSPEGGQVNRQGYIRTANGEIANEAVLEYRYPYHGAGTEATPYMITSKEDWYMLAKDIESGASTSGNYFALTADITVHKMLGTEQNPFSGIFNGYGCTLTANINENMTGAAPFHTISGATIKNLKVAGTVKGYSYNAGLVGYVKGDDNLIQNCEVSASIGSPSGYNGGFVGHAGCYATTIQDCVFRGGFFMTVENLFPLFNSTFVGWDETGAQITLNRCMDLTKDNPIGRGQVEPTTATNIYSNYNKSPITDNNAWENIVPQLAYSVTGAEATLTLTGLTGMAWDGSLYAAQGETIEFTVDPGYATYVSTDGTFNQDQASCTLVMPAEDVSIVNQNSVYYAITDNISTGGNVEINKAEATPGMKVFVTITRDPHYLLDELTVKDDHNNEIQMTMYDEGFGYFIMPTKPVTVTVTFNKQYSFENGELRLLLGDFSSYGNSAFGPDVTENRGDVLKVTAAEGVRFTGTCAGLFQNFSNCTEMDLTGVNTSAMTHTTSMFAGCTSLKKLNIKGWNMLRVEYMVEMFKDCRSLRELDLSGVYLNTNANMREMFTCSDAIDNKNPGVCKLTLPAGMDVTASMYLRRGYYTKEGHYNSGWQLLGDKTVVSGEGQYDGWTWATLPAQPTTATYVWSRMPDDFVLELPDGQDNSKTVADWDGVTTNVRLTGRTLYKDGYWNTLCLPFDMGYEQDQDKLFLNSYMMELDTYSKYNDQNELFYYGDEQDESEFTRQTGFDEATNTLYLYLPCDRFLYGSATAGTPFFVMWENDPDHPTIESPEFSNVTIDKTMNDIVSEDGKVRFAGNYGPFVIDGSNIDEVIYLGANNIIGYASAPRTLRSFRAHFELSYGSPSHAAIRQVTPNNGNTTRVTPTTTGIKADDDAWYNIFGIKLNGVPTEKGLYIHKGIKVSIK